MYRALVLYHYFYPDDVVSSTHISELAEGLAQRGWHVTAMPSNRGCRDESRSYPAEEKWNGIHIRRVWRPRVPQASAAGRLVNALWMIARWSLAALAPRHAPDVVIVGTDPILSVLVARVWKLVRPKTQIIHWCFDLYPEAAAADGILKPESLIYRLLRRILAPAYKSCDLVADIGGCMRERLAYYKSSAKMVTLTPWALSEPDAPVEPDPEERAVLFGDAALGLMYSGNFGRAHAYEEILQLARLLREQNIKLVFSVRGNREQALREAVQRDDANVSFCDFAPAHRLERRLSAADIHVVSLRPEWTGMVVPSKFFGAIAAGRPVLFAGSTESAVARWIAHYGLGWILTSENIKETAEQITRYMTSQGENPRMRRRCFELYQKHFSKKHILDVFDQELRALLMPEVRCEPGPSEPSMISDYGEL
jgi:colanic acid biosynthesis glycosyl transferase WcaI